MINNALQLKTELLNPSHSIIIHRYTHVLSYLFYDAIISTIESGSTGRDRLAIARTYIVLSTPWR